jgi:hypothetical protein
MSKIVRNNEPKEKAKQTETLLIYANFVKTSNQVDKKINKLINMLKC